MSGPHCAVHGVALVHDTEQATWYCPVCDAVEQELRSWEFVDYEDAREYES